MAKQAKAAFVRGPTVWKVADRRGLDLQPLSPKALHYPLDKQSLPPFTFNNRFCTCLLPAKSYWTFRPETPSENEHGRSKTCCWKIVFFNSIVVCESTPFWDMVRDLDKNRRAGKQEVTGARRVHDLIWRTHALTHTHTRTHKLEFIHNET